MIYRSYTYFIYLIIMSLLHNMIVLRVVYYELIPIMKIM